MKKLSQSGPRFMKLTSALPIASMHHQWYPNSWYTYTKHYQLLHSQSILLS